MQLIIPFPDILPLHIQTLPLTLTGSLIVILGEGLNAEVQAVLTCKSMINGFCAST